MHLRIHAIRGMSKQKEHQPRKCTRSIIRQFTASYVAIVNVYMLLHVRTPSILLVWVYGRVSVFQRYVCQWHPHWYVSRINHIRDSLTIEHDMWWCGVRWLPIERIKCVLFLAYRFGRSKNARIHGNLFANISENANNSRTSLIGCSFLCVMVFHLLDTNKFPKWTWFMLDYRKLLWRLNHKLRIQSDVAN